MIDVYRTNSKLVIKVKLYVIIKGVSISNEVSTVSLLVVVVLANQNSTSNACVVPVNS